MAAKTRHIFNLRYRTWLSLFLPTTVREFLVAVLCSGVRVTDENRDLMLVTSTDAEPGDRVCGRCLRLEPYNAEELVRHARDCIRWDDERRQADRQ